MRNSIFLTAPVIRQRSCKLEGVWGASIGFVSYKTTALEADVFISHYAKYGESPNTHSKEEPGRTPEITGKRATKLYG